MAYINEKFIPPDKTTEKQRKSDEFRTLLLGLRKPPVDQSSYRRRYVDITQGGVDATNYESRKRAAQQAKWMEAQQKAANDAAARQYRVSTGPSTYNPGGGSSFTPNVPGAKGSFLNFINAIGKHESGNNYSAVNRDSGAMGKYQIMPGNIKGSKRGWDYEALGRDVSTSEFMHSPQIQEAIARYKLQQYYNKYGARGAAIAWYAGPGALKYSSGTLNKKQGAYSSINGYANAILKRLGL